MDSSKIKVGKILVLNKPIPGHRRGLDEAGNIFEVTSASNNSIDMMVVTPILIDQPATILVEKAPYFREATTKEKLATKISN